MTERKQTVKRVVNLFVFLILNVTNRVGKTQMQIVEDWLILEIMKYFRNNSFWSEILNNDIFRRNLQATIECLQVRTKNLHGPIPDDLFLIHQREDKKWWRGVSLKYGFHCFHALDQNCQDYELRAFINCWMIENSSLISIFCK